MSDGPHRSLKMRKGWKWLCELADNSAASEEEICETGLPALEQDWRGDISPSLYNRVCEILSDPQGVLFRDQQVVELETLRRETAGYGFARSLLDCAIQTVIEGGAGPTAMYSTIRNAVADRAARGIRQVEEHYVRESSAPRAQNVRARIEKAFQGAALDGFAMSLSGSDSAPPSSSPKNRDGIDDGVQL